VYGHYEPLSEQSGPAAFDRNLKTCALWIIGAADRSLGLVGKAKHMKLPRTNLASKLGKVAQPPLSCPGATTDSDRAQRPPLASPKPNGEELNPGDRVEGLGNFGKPTGDVGTVQQSNEVVAVVQWDGDGEMRLGRAWLRKIQPWPDKVELWRKKALVGEPPFSPKDLGVAEIRTSRSNVSAIEQTTLPTVHTVCSWSTLDAPGF
jgi:hypothetical protein